MALASAFEFLTDFANTLQFSRLNDAASAISHVWRTRHGFDAKTDPRWGAFLKQCRRLGALLREVRPAGRPQRDPLPPWTIEHFWLHPPAGLDPDRLLLMVTVLAYGMRGMQRGGQIADLEERDLTPRWMFSDRPPACDGANQVPPGLAAEFRITRHKRDPSGQHPMCLLVEQGAGAACPVRLLDLYLWRSRGVRLRDWRSTSGRRLFSLHGAPLDTSDLRLFVRIVAGHAGLTGYFGSHSLRISGACYAILAGRSWEEVQAIGGWLSDAVMVYLRTVVAAVAGCSAAMGF